MMKYSEIRQPVHIKNKQVQQEWRQEMQSVMESYIASNSAFWTFFRLIQRYFGWFRPISFYLWNQCRKESDPTYNDAETELFDPSKSIEDDVIQIQSRSMSDPPISDIDFKNKMVLFWITLRTYKKYIDRFLKSGLVIPIDLSTWITVLIAIIVPELKGFQDRSDC